MAAKDKKSSPTPVKVRMAFWIDEELAEKIRALAFEGKVKHSDIVSEWARAAPEPKIKRG